MGHPIRFIKTHKMTADPAATRRIFAAIVELKTCRERKLPWYRKMKKLAHQISWHSRHAKQNNKHLSHKIHRLYDELAAVKRRLRHLKHEVHELEKQLVKQVHRLQDEIDFIQTELESGIIPNPTLEQLLTGKLGQTVTITTLGGTVTGTVIAVGPDAVELQDSGGHLVIIPFAKIMTIT